MCTSMKFDMTITTIVMPAADKAGRQSSNNATAMPHSKASNAARSKENEKSCKCAAAA